MPKAVRGTGTPTPAASVEPCAYSILLRNPERMPSSGVTGFTGVPT